MSSYLEEDDSASDDEKIVVSEVISSEEEAAVRESVAAAKAEGNKCFGAKDYEGAITHYSVLHDLFESAYCKLRIA